MGTAVVGVAGALLGVLAGGLLQHTLAARTRRWQREDALGKLKRAVVDAVDRRRLAVIELFKADLGIGKR